MHIKKLTPDYLTVIKYIFYFFACIVLNKIEDTIFPYSLALFVCATNFKLNVFFSSFFYILSFIILGDLNYISFSLICSLFILITTLIYKKLQIKTRFECVLFTTILLVPFCFLNMGGLEPSLTKRLFVSVISIILTLIIPIGNYEKIKSVLSLSISYISIKKTHR